MPTPIGHALGGLAAGVLVAGRTASLVPVGKRSWSLLWVWAICGMLPDVDFLFGSHRGVTHTLGAMFAAGIVAAMVARRRPVVWGAVAASYGTHLLLDWLGADTVAPLGIMALWPFADTFYASPYGLFPAVCREYWLVCCWIELVQTVSWELLLLGPVVAVALWFRRRR